MASGAQGPTPSEYIVHHLTHLNGTGDKQTKVVDFSLINWDTVIISVVLVSLVHRPEEEPRAVGS